MSNNSEPGSVEGAEEDKGKVEEEEEEKLLVPGSPPSPREEWTNPVDFFVSTLGVAVGLGNIWRFPKLCYENGGGSFLIPYVLMLLVCGLPLFFLELTLGQYSGSGPLKVFRRMTPVAGGLGLSLVIVGGFFAFYFIVVTSWSIWYLAASLDPAGLPWVRCGKEFNTPSCWSNLDQEACNNFTADNNNTTVENNDDTSDNIVTSSFDNLSEPLLYYNSSCWSANSLCRHLAIGSWQPELATCSDGAILRTSPTVEYFERHVLGNQENSWQDYGGLRWQSVVCLAAAWILVALALVRGTKSQGKAAYFTTFVPYILILILSIRGFSLQGASLGLSFLFTPQWEKLLDMDVWKAAALQIIFSLGSCSGCNLSLASYNRFNHNCMRDAVLIAICNCATSIFCSCVVFSILGYMAHSTSRPVDQVVQGGEGLVFVVYPEVVSLLPEVADVLQDYCNTGSSSTCRGNLRGHAPGAFLLWAHFLHQRYDGSMFSADNDASSLPQQVFIVHQYAAAVHGHVWFQCLAHLWAHDARSLDHCSQLCFAASSELRRCSGYHLPSETSRAIHHLQNKKHGTEDGHQ